MRKNDHEIDYYNIPKTEWLELLAFRQLAPLFAQRGLHVEAALDGARYAVEKNLIRVGGAKSAHELSVFDAEGCMFELGNAKPHTMVPVRGGHDETPAAPQRHPALDPRDEVPGTPAFDKLDSLRKLNIANKIEAWKVEQAKAKQAATKK